MVTGYDHLLFLVGVIFLPIQKKVRDVLLYCHHVYYWSQCKLCCRGTKAIFRLMPILILLPSFVYRWVQRLDNLGGY